MPGPPITASYTVTNAMITTGQVQFVNPARTTFSGGSATVQMLPLGALYNARLNEVDLRVAKRIRVGPSHFRLTADVGNLLNESAVQAQSNTYGANWQKPSFLLIGRIAKFGMLFEF